MKSLFSIADLQKEINRRVKIASESLLQNDVPGAKENIEWIDTATDLIAKSKKKSNTIIWAASVGLISIFFIGIGFSLRIPTTNLSIDIITRGIRFKLTEDWVLNNRFLVSELAITNLREVSARGANINVVKNQSFDLNVKGENIIVDKLMFSSNATIRIQSEDKGYAFIVNNDTLVTDIQVGKAHVNIDNGLLLDTALNFEIPELFHITSFASKAIPIEIKLVDTTGWIFRDMLISDIEFMEESTPGSGNFISSIISGKVRVLEVDQEIQLQQGDWLLLKNLVNRRIQLTKSIAGIFIHIEGEVSQAKAGSELFEKKINPTIVEYLYHAKSFAFFWSAIVFMCSFIWSLKNTIFLN